MKHGLLITAMSFVLVAGAGPSLAITPLPGGIPSGATGQQFAQAQPGGQEKMQPGGQGQMQSGEEGKGAGKPAKRSAQSQPSGQQGGQMGESGQGGQQPGQKRAQSQPSGQQPSAQKGEQPSGQGERMGQQGTQTPSGERSAQGQKPAGAGTQGGQGSRMGASSGQQPGMKGEAQGRGEAGVAAGGQAGGARGTASLTTQQRTRITTVFKEARVQPLENVNFSISVGKRIPREVHLYPLPREVVEIRPAWRHYEYILVKGDIIVVDPATFEIVAVLPVA